MTVHDAQLLGAMMIKAMLDPNDVENFPVLRRLLSREYHRAVAENKQELMTEILVPFKGWNIEILPLEAE